ncbi:Concanavalin A-like lectin/glucanase, subgroup [Cynara cardunculus var. scolymus]|uniref:Concanavalin A-like lectin/glucanase, subgroup n=1 Tax=Cynara cardunculus var. scolymus TaxID=59895 RepID=A0A103YFY2_CYNCS|nr:Concanavalin A-like lectin/glucanase, subgroup [Cynara cardunculus var. scolymus]
MHLHHFCFVLPSDGDDIHPFDHPHSKSPPPPKRRSCGIHLHEVLCRTIHRFFDFKRDIGFCSFCVKPPPTIFHDTEGVQFSKEVTVGAHSPKTFTYSELYIATKGFSQDEILGSGGFGRVFRAVLPTDGTMVAVKCLAETGERFEKSFAAELVAVAHLRHRNLVPLRGWCVHNDQLLIVYDYMPNRSLDRVLFRRVEKNKTAVAPLLSWDRRVKIVKGLAAALFYLHEQLEAQIIHRDVKTSNVMLDSHFNARLGDFGLARWLEHELGYQTRTPSMNHHPCRLVDTTRIGGTIGYLPPESFQKKGVTTAKSDVFSFGIVLLEIASGRRSVDLTLPDDQIILVDRIRRLADEKMVLQAADSRLPDGSYHLHDMEHLIHIGLLCTLHDPHSRPNMRWIIEALSGDSNRLSEVDFGTAYYGVLDNHDIIVKRLGMKTCPALRVRFAKELSNLGRLRHRNLIQLRGWCTEQGEMLVVYDYSANRLLGQLLSHHSHRRSQVLQWNHRYNIVKSLACAILYLHDEWEEQVIHRNITSSAIYIDPDMNPRLGSFALAEFLTRNEHGHHIEVDKKVCVRGIFGYMAPEYMELGKATPMADVYSFGVVVLEVVSGRMAVDFRRPEVLLVKRVHVFEAQKGNYEELVDPRLDGEYNRKELVRLVKLAMACTRSNPDLRPTMRNVVSIVEGHDRCFTEEGQKEGIDEWKARNALSLSLIRRIQALGIQ